MKTYLKIIFIFQRLFLKFYFKLDSINLYGINMNLLLLLLIVSVTSSKYIIQKDVLYIENEESFIFSEICKTYTVNIYKNILIKNSNIERISNLERTCCENSTYCWGNDYQNFISINSKIQNLDLSNIYVRNVLKFSNNEINHIILKNVFAKQLYLDGNNIYDLEIGDNNVIQSLYLNDSNIEEINFNLLLSITNLSFIDLSNNRIKIIDIENNFLNIEFPIYINISNNLINCENIIDIHRNIYLVNTCRNKVKFFIVLLIVIAVIIICVIIYQLVSKSKIITCIRIMNHTYEQIIYAETIKEREKQTEQNL